MILSKIEKEAAPQEGDYKITYHFAWLPKKVDGFKIWFEQYKKVYQWVIRKRVIYCISSRRTFHFNDCGGWDLIKVQRQTTAVPKMDNRPSPPIKRNGSGPRETIDVQTDTGNISLKS